MQNEQQAALTPRCNKQRKELRQFIEDALSDGDGLDAIVSAAKAKFGPAARYVRRMARGVQRRIEREGEEFLKARRTELDWWRSVRRRQQLYQDACDRGDFKLALEVEKDLCKLLGIYADERSSKDDPSAEIRGKEVNRKIVRELAKLAAKRSRKDAAAPPPPHRGRQRRAPA